MCFDQETEPGLSNLSLDVSGLATLQGTVPSRIVEIHDTGLDARFPRPLSFIHHRTEVTGTDGGGKRSLIQGDKGTGEGQGAKGPRHGCAFHQTLHFLSAQ